MSTLHSLQERLQLKDEKNLLLQGLPLSIEKQFIKFSFSKNVTPLLKSKKIDFALVFAFSSNQLKSILQEVVPALHQEAKFWVAYPKASSKIASDLSREANWSFVEAQGFETECMVAVDNLWNAVRFKKAGNVSKVVANTFSVVVCEEESYSLNTVAITKGLQTKSKKQKDAAAFIESFTTTVSNTYGGKVENTKKPQTPTIRLDASLELLKTRKKALAAK